jgi:5,10-methylenetetrahydrofolate reductase
VAAEETTRRACLGPRRLAAGARLGRLRQVTGGCPKRMTYGPCGGVRADLQCEMAPIACPFATSGEVVRWAGLGPLAAEPLPPPGSDPHGPAGPVPLLAQAARRPVVLTDFTVAPFDPDSIAAVAAELAGTCDGVLVGEHQNRPDFPPTFMTARIRAAGHAPWITLTCRDRNRIVLDQELAGLAAAGAAGVLCVTGDGRGRDVRPEVTQVFDIDGTQLAALATAAGLAAAVVESPDAPPRALRPSRLAEKQRTGARLGVLNHVGSPARVAAFMAAARGAGLTLPVVAGVPVYTDERSAGVLRLPGLEIDDAAIRAVVDARDPVAAGVAAALAEARALLAIEGVVGVNLSGSASAHGPLAGARVKAAVGRELIGGA